MKFLFKCLPVFLLGVILFVPSALADNSVKRVGGSTRYDTAVLAAKQSWSEAGTAVIVGGTAYPDAITAAPLAYQKNAPLLYTNKDQLSAGTKKGLIDLKTKNVIIVGGTPAVSKNTENQIKKLGISVKRLSGSTRYATAAKVANEMARSTTALVVNGFVDADGMAAISYASSKKYPILFTNDSTLNGSAANAIKNLGIKNTIVIGGTKSISNSLYNKLPNPSRVTAKNRYDLSVKLSKKTSLSTSYTYITNGFKEADSIVAGAISSKQGRAHLLTNGDNLSKEVRTYIGDKNMKSFTVIGKASSLSDNVASQLKNPVVGKTVFIDPGHGDQDSGATGYGLLEKNVNLDIGKRLNSKLYSAGALPVMSRTGDTFDSLEERVNKGAKAKADIFISVHANANDNNSANGTETYYDKTYQSANSLKLAQNIQPQMVSALGTRDRGVKTAGFYVIKYSQMPSVLLETGFVTSPIDSNILKQSAKKDRLATGISKGVSSYFK
ncbi:N-acetylmuramoyl-L-alanine amidase [Bacillus atrophaeus]|uniref:N-acetylmuramoyl-L-alanine amidase n=1 Tax=Bacillus atrophaeus TaxID=1452 RepID=UPI000C05CB99|nr:N-acetylmuramoyl-L-alanine amidase [Bacillus atrophaeus]ATO27410.1 N-acetylmuramoyl-L-alanine amidase [Bacillus atrophaeus]MBJ7894804.1 N-acetylmuramoyl-L-alanine amidase [Bacillus atrophaeus]MCY8517054.1 N-acetylmuramoyl-L-alanine amidase [Bacillus atrophaeus]MCY9111679.1 N-acetylmuramoyl-L-alanine amidase [Bacillus atrophaeus]MDL5143144.1 N-acetylmuramoyl-L-alanine amidase [Bacillus atrophaeus]